MTQDYSYLYDTHVHTSESSACGASTALEMAKAYKAAGYAGIIITNHNWGGNTCVDRSLPWTTWVDEFYKPYFTAKEWGDKNGLSVFYGYEAGYDGTEFLIYGVTIDWLKEHPEIKDATVKEQFELVSAAGGIVIQAHPFRKADYIKEIRLFPEYVNGVEGINTAHVSPKAGAYRLNADSNELALSYAIEHDFAITGGSDSHFEDILGGGMAFKRSLTSIQDFVKQITDVRDYVVTDGAIRTDAHGRRID